MTEALEIDLPIPSSLFTCSQARARAIAFGASGLADIVAAILFGFGSQTILTKGVEVAQKWAVNRSKPESI